jgi:hypothetical protein
MLLWALVGAPFKGRATHLFAFGLLQKAKDSIWLFIKVIVWICRIATGRKRKLKKVCCNWEVQEQNVGTPKLAIEEQNVTTSELATKTNVATLKLGIGELRVDETNI